MLSRNSLKIVGLLLVSIILGLLAAACGAQPAAPQTIIQTVEVEKVVEKVVEVVETVEVEKVVEKEVEKIVTVEVMKDGEATEAMSSDDNPYRPSDLFAAVEDIKAATEGKSPPAGAKFAPSGRLPKLEWLAPPRNLMSPSVSRLPRLPTCSANSFLCWKPL